MATSALEARVRESLGRRRSKLTIEQYSQFARRFEQFVDKPPETLTSQDALAYIDNLIEAKRAPATVEWSVAALKRVYRACGLKQPFTSDDIPKLPNIIKRQAMPSVTDARRLIYWARRNGSNLEILYLVMSTVYGLRRGELAQLRKANFAHNLSSVDINTLKHGQARTHLIPEPIVVWLRTPLGILKEIPAYNTTTLSQIYQEVSEKAGHKRQFREGWHGIRRLLDTELLTRGVPPHFVNSFMRWSPPRGDMTSRYFMADEKAIDRRVFESHPLLEFWT
jgi:integrase